MSTANHPPSEPLNSRCRMAEVLAAFSLATDLGTGKSMGHAQRACYLGMALARELQLSNLEQAELYYSFLLMHSGCAALSLAIAPVIKGDELAAIDDITLRDETNLWDMLDWMRRNVSPDASLPTRALNIIQALLRGPEEEDVRGVCEVAVRVAQRLDMPHEVQDALRHYLERWDGEGPFGLQGEAIPLKARLLHLALKIDACNTVYGREAAKTMALDRKGKVFDPRLVEAFFLIAGDSGLWETLAGLTDREIEVLQQFAKGDTNRQIAQELVISERTVAHHLEHIYNKIGISSRAAAVFFAMEVVMVPLILWSTNMRMWSLS
jgi:DNA-binding CsgD family transcriptional regulator